MVSTSLKIGRTQAKRKVGNALNLNEHKARKQSNINNVLVPDGRDSGSRWRPGRRHAKSEKSAHIDRSTQLASGASQDHIHTHNPSQAPRTANTNNPTRERPREHEIRFPPVRKGTEPKRKAGEVSCSGSPAINQRPDFMYGGWIDDRRVCEPFPIMILIKITTIRARKGRIKRAREREENTRQNNDSMFLPTIKG